MYICLPPSKFQCLMHLNWSELLLFTYKHLPAGLCVIELWKSSGLMFAGYEAAVPQEVLSSEPLMRYFPVQTRKETQSAMV